MLPGRNSCDDCTYSSLHPSGGGLTPAGLLRLALQACLNAHCEAEPAFMAGLQEGLDLLQNDGSVFACHPDIDNTIKYSELGASSAIMSAGDSTERLWSLMVRQVPVDSQGRRIEVQFVEISETRIGVGLDDNLVEHWRSPVEAFHFASDIFDDAIDSIGPLATAGASSATGTAGIPAIPAIPA